MSVWDTRYPEHVTVRLSANGGLVRVCFSVTPGMAVCWLVVLRLNVPVNNFSVMSGRSHRFLGN